MPRRSSRASSVAAAAKISGAAEDDDAPSESESPATETNALKGTENEKATLTEKKASTKKKRAPPKKKAATKKATAKAAPSDDEDESKPNARKKAAATKRKGESTPDDEGPVSETTKSPKKKKASDHQRWTERTPLARHWDPERAASAGSYAFTVVSWNVAGLRALVKKRPDALANLAEKYRADVICLQETKLQEGHLDDPKLKLREHFDEKLEGFDGHWSYSSEKKGYSGTAMFIRRRKGGAKTGDGKKGKKQAKLNFGGKSNSSAKEGDSASTGDVPVSHIVPVRVDTELGLLAHDGEGRTITAEFPLFYLTNVYVPNSGAKLDRLGYRTQQWDVDFLKKMQRLEEDGGKPVVWLGDLNVAHGEKDTWNEGAKHLAKSAGTTTEERSSFERQLGAGYADAFRRLHPEGRGHYSYWSQRAGNREPNKGLRLDYFICSNELMEDGDGKKARVRDSYMVPEELGSDHCPIVLEIEIKK